MTIPHLPSYPRLRGPLDDPDAPGGSPDNPILPPEGTQGPPLLLCYGLQGWVLLPRYPVTMAPPAPPSETP
jgi:hypothetical protein